MNLLSIDWDYFFPNISKYDWQMDDNKFIYYELIWKFRWSNRSLCGTHIAKNDFHIDHTLFDNFWDNVLGDTIPLVLFISDSHSDISSVFKFFKGSKFNVWNFDQHHDMGYRTSRYNKLDCGNWVNHFEKRINQYNLIYPSWRMKNLENESLDNDIQIHYEMPPAMPNFDVLFICRSSPFTPPWNDSEWLKFIHYFEQFPELWNSKICAPYVMKAREFDIDEANRHEQQLENLINDKIKNIGGIH